LTHWLKARTFAAQFILWWRFASRQLEAASCRSEHAAATMFFLPTITSLL